MKREELLNKHYHLLSMVSTLPKKIVSSGESALVTQFVLHELFSKDFFNIPKAAYFVDNPDFDCLKGIAGYSQHESCPLDWSHMDKSASVFEAADFNKKVRSICRPSCRLPEITDATYVSSLAHDLGFEQHAYLSWPLKYDNHGILLFEQVQDDSDFVQEYLSNALYLLSFCPIM